MRLTDFLHSDMRRYHARLERRKRIIRSNAEIMKMIGNLYKLNNRYNRTFPRDNNLSRNRLRLQNNVIRRALLIMYKAGARSNLPPSLGHGPLLYKIKQAAGGRNAFPKNNNNYVIVQQPNNKINIGKVVKR